MILCLFSGCTSVNEEKLVTSYNNTLNGYSVSLYQVGEPRGAFGSVNAKLVLKDAKSNIIDETEFELANDGANVLITNIIEVNWFEDRAEVRLKELDTTNKFSYTLNYR